MPKLSRIEFEIGADFATLSQKDRLRALRIFGDALPGITSQSLTFGKELKAAGNQIAATPVQGIADAMAAMVRMDSSIAEATDRYAERVLEIVMTACDSLKELGLTAMPRPRRKH